MTTHKEWDGSTLIAHGHISFTFLSALLPSAEGAWVDTTRHLQFLPPSTESCFNITAKLITPFTDLAWHFPWCFSSTVFLFWPLIYFFFSFMAIYYVSFGLLCLFSLTRRWEQQVTSQLRWVLWELQKSTGLLDCHPERKSHQEKRGEWLAAFKWPQ